MSPADLPQTRIQPIHRPRSSRQWRITATRLLAFILVLSLEAAFNVGVLLGRVRWKNDMDWVRPVFFVMSGTLLVLLWALYRQVWRITREYVEDTENR